MKTTDSQTLGQVVGWLCLGAASAYTLFVFFASVEAWLLPPENPNPDSTGNQTLNMLWLIEIPVAIVFPVVIACYQRNKDDQGKHSVD